MRQWPAARPETLSNWSSETRWATDSGTREAWIAVDIGKPLVIQCVRIEEALAERVQKFEREYRDGQEWKPIFAGQKTGHWFQRKFVAPVTAQEFRLSVLDATDGPTINEIELFEE